MRHTILRGWSRTIALGAAVIILTASPQAQRGGRPSAPAEAGAHTASNDAFYWLNEQNKASLIMLVDERIITSDLAATIARSLTQVIADGAKPGAVRSRDYLVVEADLMKIGGPEVSRLHSGRSRQD